MNTLRIATGETPQFLWSCSDDSEAETNDQSEPCTRLKEHRQARREFEQQKKNDEYGTARVAWRQDRWKQYGQALGMDHGENSAK
jgi:hypothetical protein